MAEAIDNDYLLHPLPLPPRPNLEHYKKLAKDFQHACKSGDPRAVRDWASRWVETLARLLGKAGPLDARNEIGWDTERVERQWHKTQRSKEHSTHSTLAYAQFFVARCHGFASWPKFTKHLEAVARADSPVAHFESAVDAITRGDIETLDTLLREKPGLVRMRSTRGHRSTLLHYVSANGVEDFRQKTPKYIVAIATLLLDGGAYVNADSIAYGGRSTTLGLTATSYHPEGAGVQIPLLELLIDRGATIDGLDGGSVVVGCLRNGRRQAAEYLAGRGARLNLEGAAGIGRLDVVQRFFDDHGTLQPPATEKQTIDGFTWACRFGQTAVVDFLLGNGLRVGASLRGGETGLHWAAFGAHRDTVKLLLTHDAPVDVVDTTHHGTPLEWALHAWENSRGEPSYYDVVALLALAGARLTPTWFEHGADRKRAAAKVQSDPRMLAALRGEMTL